MHHMFADINHLEPPFSHYPRGQAIWYQTLCFAGGIAFKEFILHFIIVLLLHCTLLNLNALGWQK